MKQQTKQLKQSLATKVSTRTFNAVASSTKLARLLSIKEKSKRVVLAFMRANILWMYLDIMHQVN
ncbi:hypothetical protein B9W47_16090 [Acinetobacter baumannii]|nr:hypothetical protein A7A60_00140 [Acinetobacter baumannii]OWX36754.1 hypothetical protein A7A48_04180 [Acinetobacter baumannii]OWX69636.1 hypothetical protein A7A61_00395 [Acinetobacter baumannii]PRN38867.1 hypothetical protein B9W47_16090 [Acinetobacter baumannii]